MNFDWLSMVFLLLALVLPVSALAGRKLQWKKSVMLVLTWAAIFVVVAVLITLVRGSIGVGEAIGSSV